MIPPARAEKLAVCLAPLLIILIAYRTAPSFGLVSDAVFLIEENPLMRNLGNLPAMLTHDYFWSPAGESIGYWRPLTKASWLLETVFGGGRPWIYHLVQIAWLAGAAAGVVCLGIALDLTRLQAVCAGTIFALHPATSEPACLVMARSDLACAAGMIWSVATWLRWQAAGRTWRLVFHTAAVAVAFASKETAVLLVPLLIIWALLSRRAADSRLRLLTATAPVLLVAGAYFLLRAQLLGSVTGAAFSLEPIKIFVGGGTYLRSLVPLAFTTGLQGLARAEAVAPDALALAGATWVTAIGIALWCWRQGWRAGIALLAWLVGSLLPVLVTGEMRVPGALDKIAVADRWLFAAIAPFALGAVGAIVRIASPRIRVVSGLAVGVWAVATLLVAPKIHGAYRDHSSLLASEEAAYAGTSIRLRTAADGCRQQERALARAAVSGDVEAARISHARVRADGACHDTVNADLTFLSLLLGKGRIEEALPIALDVARPGRLYGRHRTEGLALVTETLFAAGYSARALAILEAAVRRDSGDCSVRGVLARAYGAAGRHQDAGRLHEEQRQCLLKQSGRAGPDNLDQALRKYQAADDPP